MREVPSGTKPKPKSTRSFLRLRSWELLADKELRKKPLNVNTPIESTTARAYAGIAIIPGADRQVSI